MKIIFLFIFASLTLLEASDWWVYTYEDVGTLKAVYNYLAMVGDDAGYNQTIQTVLMAGMSFVLVLKFLDLTAVPKYFVTVTGVMLVIFGTTATVHITNVKSYTALNPQVDNYAVVDNVPYIFAVLTSAFSTIGYNGAELVETIFTSIGDNAEVMENSFLKTGHLGGFKVLEKLNSIDPMLLNDDTKAFSALYTDYLNSCIFGIAYVLKPDLKNVLLTQPDLFGYISPITSEVDEIKRIATQQILKSDGVVTTCAAQYAAAKVKYDLIKADNKLYSAAKSLISRVTSNVDNSASSTINMVTNSTLTDAQSKITTYLMNNGIRSAFESSWMSYGVGTTSSTQAAYGTGLAVAQMQLAGKIKSSSAGIMIPTMHSVLQALMYVLFPFVLIVQLFIGGIKILQNYVLGLLWLEFWVPSFSVLNYFTYKEAQTQSVDKLINLTNNVNGPDGLMTLANQSEILNTIANQAAIAGDMYWMIPAIAGFILFASFQSMTGITSAAAGLVGQYSSNQTLEGERAKFAAYDQINSELKKDNPMYTGNIGTVSAMAAQSSITSSASMAAGRFMASGGNINDIGALTKADMYGGFKNLATASTEAKAFTNGGSIENARNTVENNANIDAFGKIGNSNAINLNNGMLGKVEKTTELDINDKNNTGSARYEALQKNFNNVANGSEVSANIKENSTVKGLTRQIDVAGGDDNLVNLNVMKAGGETSKISATNTEAVKNGKTYEELINLSETNKTSKNIADIKGQQLVDAADKTGSLNDKGVKVVTTTTGADIESKSRSIDNLGEKKYIDVKATETVKDDAVLAAKQDETKRLGANYVDLNSAIARTEVDEKKITQDSGVNTGYLNNDGTMTQKGFNSQVGISEDEYFKKIGEGTASNLMADNSQIDSHYVSKVKGLTEPLVLQNQAVEAHENGITENSSVESFLWSKGQSFSATGMDGTETTLTQDADGNTISKKEEKTTEEGRSLVFKDKNGEVVNSNLDGSNKIDTSNISLNNNVTEQKTSEDYSYSYNASKKWNFSQGADYTVANVGAETFNTAEKLAKQNEEATFDHLRNQIGIDILGNSAKALPFGGAIAPLITSIIKDTEVAITDATNESGYRNVPGNPNYKADDNLSAPENRINAEDKTKINYIGTRPNLTTNSGGTNY